MKHKSKSKSTKKAEEKSWVIHAREAIEKRKALKARILWQIMEARNSGRDSESLEQMYKELIES